jgi:PAS domain S-box-containing protein
MQQGMVSSNSLKQLQQTQSNQLLSLNFDDDNELQNLAGMVDDEDLPDVFWDYEDVGNIPYSDDGHISTQSVAAVLNDKTQKKAGGQADADSFSNAAAPAPTPAHQQSQTQQSNSNTRPAGFNDAASIDINNLNNYLTGFTQPGLSGNLGGYPFLLPALDRQNFQAQLPNALVSVKQGHASNPNNNGANQQQHPAAQQALQPSQLVNSVPNILANQGNQTNAASSSNNCQQQQQQALQNQLFGVPAPVFSPQVSVFHQSIQQQNNQQVQNLQYLQQLQGNTQQQQLVQQHLFPTGALMQGNNPNMLPPQQQLLQSQQQQIGLQQQQQQQQGSQQQSKPSSQSQAAAINTSIQQQQQLYQSQLLAQGGSQTIPQGGRQQNNNLAGLGTPQSASISKQNNLNSTSQLQSYPSHKQPPKTFQSPNLSKNDVKAVVVVSSSDTDGEHTVSQAKKSKRSPSNTSTMSMDISHILHESITSNSASSLTVERLLDDKTGSAIDQKQGDENMTEAERALANRKRNREHARNTRARKKAYLESLKNTLDELCKERDSLVSERAGAASLLLEIQRTRTDVLLSFFALRSTYEKRRPLWSSILDESFTCVMPVTPYRSFPASEVQISKCQRTIMGVDGMIADAASKHVLLNSLVDRAKYPAGKVEFRYTLIAEEAVVSGSQMMARWTMATTNFTKLGAKREVKKMGMLCARFNTAHKIVSLELMFDVMAFMLQLKQSAGASAFTVVPNTVQTCIGPFGNSPMVMTLADRPYTIVQVNESWEQMTGWKAEDVVGKESCKILQSDRTEKPAVDELMTSIHYQRPAFSVLTNYTRNKERVFRNFISIYPLSADSKITHYVGLTLHAEWLGTADNNKNEQRNEETIRINVKKEISATPNALNNDRTPDSNEIDQNSSSSGTVSSDGPTYVSNP